MKCRSDFESVGVLFSMGHTFCRGPALARNKQRQRVSPHSKTAVKWSLEGAIQRVYQDQSSDKLNWVRTYCDELHLDLDFVIKSEGATYNVVDALDL